MYGLEWAEENRNGKVERKHKLFETEAQRERFERKLESKNVHWTSHYQAR